LLNFQGKASANSSLAEDSAGQVQAFSVGAEEYRGTSNVTLVYDRDVNLMPNSDGILSDPKAKSIMVKQPGEASVYLLLTRGLDQRLYYHTINMNLVGNGTILQPKGEVTFKNQLFDNGTNYGRHFAAVEGYVNGKVFVYTTQYTDAVTLGVTGSRRRGANFCSTKS